VKPWQKTPLTCTQSDSSGNQYCSLAISPSATNYDNVWGDAIMRAGYFVFDLDNGQVSLGQARYSDDSKIVAVQAGPHGLASAINQPQNAQATQTYPRAPFATAFSRNASVFTANNTIGVATISTAKSFGSSAFVNPTFTTSVLWGNNSAVSSRTTSDTLSATPSTALSTSLIASSDTPSTPPDVSSTAPSTLYAVSSIPSDGSSAVPSVTPSDSFAIPSTTSSTTPTISSTAPNSLSAVSSTHPDAPYDRPSITLSKCSTTSSTDLNAPSSLDDSPGRTRSQSYLVTSATEAWDPHTTSSEDSVSALRARVAELEEQLKRCGCSD
jgi:hypothetical protein